MMCNFGHPTSVQPLFPIFVLKAPIGMDWNRVINISAIFSPVRKKRSYISMTESCRSSSHSGSPHVVIDVTDDDEEVRNILVH